MTSRHPNGARTAGCLTHTADGPAPTGANARSGRGSRPAPPHATAPSRKTSASNRSESCTAHAGARSPWATRSRATCSRPSASTISRRETPTAPRSLLRTAPLSPATRRGEDHARGVVPVRRQDSCRASAECSSPRARACRCSVLTGDRHPHEQTARYPTPRITSQPSSREGSRNRNGRTATA